MRKLFSILLSFQLIIAPVAIAADDSLAAATAQAATAQAAAGSIGGDVATASTYDKAHGEGGYDYYMKQILILAMSMVGANILTSCIKGFMIPSIAVYMAGSVTLILSEIAGAKAENQRHKNELDSIEMDIRDMPKEGSEMQKKMLQQSRDEQQATLDYILQKRNWMIAITTIYTAAMGIAIGEEFYGRAAMIPDGQPGYDAAVKAQCSQYTKNFWANKLIALAIMGAWGFAVSKVDGSGTINMVGGILAGLLMLSETISSKVNIIFETPIPRAITFGVHAAIGGVLIGGLVQRQKAAESNIEKLDKVIKDFKTLEENGASSGSGEITAPPPPKAGKVARLGKSGKSENVCLSAKSEISAKACGNPKPTPRPRLTFGGDMSTLDDVGAMGTDMSTAINGPHPEGATAIADGIIKKAARVKAITEKLKKKFNEKLKAEGKKPVDFEKEIQKGVAANQAMLDKVAAANGLKTADISTPPKNIDLGDKDEMGPLGDTSAATGTAAAPALDLGMDEELSELTEPDKVSQSGEGIDQFETNEADISKARDVPIWVQLTNRYILNYNKIFEKNKPTVAVPVPEATAPVATPGGDPPKDAKK